MADHNKAILWPSDNEEDQSEPLQLYLLSEGLQLGECDHIEWGPMNHEHPRNWAWWTVAYNISFVMAWDCFTTAMTTVGTSASVHARHEFGMSRVVGYFVFTTVTLLGEGLGSIFFPPFSESFGRKGVYIASTIIFTVFTGLTAVPSLTVVIIGRFVSGVADAVPLCVSPGTIEDMLDTKSQIWGLSAWATASNTGLAVGPIVAAYLTENYGWRVPFYAATVIGFVFFLFALGLRESRPGLLLQRKVAEINKKTEFANLKVRNPDRFPSFRQFAQQALFRPLRLLFTEPIVMVCSILSAIAFGLIYGLTEGLTVVYTEFGFSSKASSLAFVPILIGLFITIVPRSLDHVMALRIRESGSIIPPEANIVSFATSVPALAVGLWWFAWTIPPRVAHVPWILSMGGLVLIGYAVNDINFVLASYMAASYTSYAASAFAALSLTRSLVSGALPLFTEIMFVGLGSNIAVSILAAVATLFCASPYLFLKYGKRLRQRSKFARQSLGATDDSPHAGSSE